MESFLCFLLCLASFAQLYVGAIYPYCCGEMLFIHFHCGSVFHWVNTPQHFHPFYCRWVLGIVSILGPPPLWGLIERLMKGKGWEPLLVELAASSYGNHLTTHSRGFSEIFGGEDHWKAQARTWSTECGGLTVNFPLFVITFWRSLLHVG